VVLPLFLPALLRTARFDTSTPATVPDGAPAADATGNDATPAAAVADPAR
jgi:hypothetical protein